MLFFSCSKSRESRAVYEILSMYETSFAKITDKYFKATAWPLARTPKICFSRRRPCLDAEPARHGAQAEAIAPDVDYDHVFGLLYKEIYFRHVYAKLTPTLEQRCESWDNYVQLFGALACSPAAVPCHAGRFLRPWW